MSTKIERDVRLAKDRERGEARHAEIKRVIGVFPTFRANPYVKPCFIRHKEHYVRESSYSGDSIYVCLKCGRMRLEWGYYPTVYGTTSGGSRVAGYIDPNSETLVR